MYVHSLRFTVALVCVAATAALHAQYVPPTPSQPFAGFINDALRASDPSLKAWDIGINERLRGEDKMGAGTTDAGSNWDFSKRPQDDNNNKYVDSRLMPHVTYTGDWFSATIEGRSSYSLGDERYNATAAGKGLSDRDGPMDIYQAFVSIGNLKEFPLSLKLGRQELLYGDQRTLGPSKWLNNPRTFDAAKLHWQNADIGMDVFTGGVVYIDNDNLNKSNAQDRFSGVYLTFPTLSSKDIIEAYGYARNVARGIVTDDWSGVSAPARFPAPQDLYMIGVRLKSKPAAYAPWDYSLEAMYQFGNRTAVFPATTVAAALAAPRLTQQAYAFILQYGYTFTSSILKPRLSLTYSFASGDKDPTDGKSQTFQNLFPSNHLFYGYFDLSSLQNLHDIRLAYNIKPISTVSVAVEAHLQYLAETSDYWYNVGGVPRNFTGAAVGSGGGYRINPNYGSRLGEEVDIVTGWSATKYALVEVGLSHYFRGSYIKDSLSAVGSKDANFVYLQLTLNL